LVAVTSELLFPLQMGP